MKIIPLQTNFVSFISEEKGSLNRHYNNWLGLIKKINTLKYLIAEQAASRHVKISYLVPPCLLDTS